MCGVLTENSLFVQKQLRGGGGVSTNIMRVRHEDFAMEPIRTTRDIYDFIGKPPTPELLDWVETATNGVKVAASQISPYSTERDAKEVLTAWRTWYTFEEVSVIQEVCKESLALLGYSKFTSEAQLANLTLPSF